MIRDVYEILISFDGRAIYILIYANFAGQHFEKMKYFNVYGSSGVDVSLVRTRSFSTLIRIDFRAIDDIELRRCSLRNCRTY